MKTLNEIKNGDNVLYIPDLSENWFQTDKTIPDRMRDMCLGSPDTDFRYPRNPYYPDDRVYMEVTAFEKCTDRMDLNNYYKISLQSTDWTPDKGFHNSSDVGTYYFYDDEDERDKIIERKKEDLIKMIKSDNKELFESIEILKTRLESVKNERFDDPIPEEVYEHMMDKDTDVLVNLKQGDYIFNIPDRFTVPYETKAYKIGKIFGKQAGEDYDGESEAEYVFIGFEAGSDKEDVDSYKTICLIRQPIDDPLIYEDEDGERYSFLSTRNKPVKFYNELKKTEIEKITRELDELLVENDKVMRRINEIKIFEFNKTQFI